MKRYFVMRHYSMHDRCYKWTVRDLDVNTDCIVFRGTAAECRRECKRLNNVEPQEVTTE